MKNWIQKEIPFETEEWRDIKGYEGLYQASSEGRIRSLDHWIYQAYNDKGDLCKRLYKGKTIKCRPNGDGYLVVGLCKDGTKHWYAVHKLIIKTFIPNPDNLPCCDHKNAIRTDNRVCNLRWCTYSSNLRDNLITRERHKNATSNNGKKCSKMVIQMTLDGVAVKIWSSMSDAGRNGFDMKSICACCKGKKNFYKGYKWEYA